MLSGGAQVLSQGEDVDVGLAEIAHRFDQLLALLAQPQDDARLREQARRGSTGPPEQLQRALVPTAVAGQLVQPRHRLGIVVEDIGAGVDDGLKRPGLPLEVGNQQFDAAGRRLAADGEDGGGEDPRAAVGQIVAVHRGDHHVLQAELAHGVSHAFGLLTILPGGLAMSHRAVSAVSRADIAEDHERRRRVLPALADVRAMCLLAHGVQVPLPHQALQSDVVRASGRAHLEPRRLGRGCGPG